MKNIFGDVDMGVGGGAGGSSSSSSSSSSSAAAVPGDAAAALLAAASTPAAPAPAPVVKAHYRGVLTIPTEFVSAASLESTIKGEPDE